MKLLQQRLQKAKSLGLERKLILPGQIDLCSNDYLGFANDLHLRENINKRINNIPIGAAGSRLLRGNLAIHTETEQLLADFVNREATLLFSSGYAANVGLLSAILQTGDLVFSDALNHASIIDGIRLSQAKKIIFPHRDYHFLEKQLALSQDYPGIKLIVTESIYSMEGTCADLKQLATLAEKYNAGLIVDEAHSTGLWGPSLVAKLGLNNKVLATIHPAGKALGVAGAWIASNHDLREYLIHFARSFLFSTAPMPILAVALQEAILLYQNVGLERAEIVTMRAKYLRQTLAKFTPIDISDSPIISIIIGDNQKTLEISQQLQHKGWDVRAIRPPTVPSGTARLRITVKWSNNEIQLQQFALDCEKIFSSIRNDL